MSFADLLKTLPTRRMRRRLARCIPQLDFMDGRPPRFVFVSGRRNRCNPEGIGCLYFSEDEHTADIEYRHQWRGTVAEFQPKLTFFARVNLRRVLDLGNDNVVQTCGLSADDLFGTWRLKTSPTRLQRLGGAISRQRSIAALRYPSAASLDGSHRGWNVAIFAAALAPSDRLEILGKSGRPIETLP